MKPQKRLCSSNDDVGRDRLSEMPDKVIVHILSRMSTLDPVRTVLLRRFGNLWTLVPTLIFNIFEFRKKMKLRHQLETKVVGRFNVFVCKVLMLHKRSSLDKFHLTVKLEYQSESVKAADVKLWLRLAMNKQAKEIKFCDLSYTQLISSNSSNLPTFTGPSLVTLILSYCRIDPQLEVSLPSLKKLLLYNTVMCEEAFQQLLTGCPSLQELRITDPYPIKKLGFRAQNIDKLSLVLTKCIEDDNPWLLNFPNVKILDLEIERTPNIIDISSVCDIYFKNNLYDINKDERKMCKMFLGKFVGAEVFRLASAASEQFLHATCDLHLLKMRWKHVVLELLVFCQRCFLGMYKLLRSLKHLEELIIYNTEIAEHQGLRSSTDLVSLKLSSPCVMPKLKTVILHGYGKPWNRQLQLVEFLLKSATVLDKLVIVRNKHRLIGVEEELEFVKSVSNFQRSSTIARVVFA